MKKNELTRLPKDVNLQTIQVGMLGGATDVENDTYIPDSNLIRVCAIEDARIKIHPNNQGVVLPKNAIEYFGVVPGDSLTITGSVNIMESPQYV